MKKINKKELRKMLNTFTVDELKQQVHELKKIGINLKTYEEYKTKNEYVNNIMKRCKIYNESVDRRRRSKRRINLASEIFLILILSLSVLYISEKIATSKKNVPVITTLGNSVVKAKSWVSAQRNSNENVQKIHNWIMSISQYLKKSVNEYDRETGETFL